MREVSEIPKDAIGRIFKIEVRYVGSFRDETCFLKVLGNGWMEYQYSTGTVCTNLIRDNSWPIRVGELHPDIFSDEQDTQPTILVTRRITCIIEIEITEQRQDFPDCKLFSEVVVAGR